MAITQAQFERALQSELQMKGFDLNLKDVKELLDIVADTVVECLQNDMREAKKIGWGKAVPEGEKKPSNPAVRVRGLGTFRVNWRPAGWGRNPGTGEKIKVKASKKLKSLPAKGLKDALAVR